MEHWQKLVLDPAHFAVLKNLGEPERKQELAEKTGLKPERCRSILQNLKEEQLAETEVTDGVRKFQRADLVEKFSGLQKKLESKTIGGTQDMVADREFSEARNQLTRDLPTEGDNRVTVAQLEAAEKLDKLL